MNQRLANQPNAWRMSRSAAPDALPAPVHEALNSPGRPLDTATRADMERRFGQDFSQVRVHVGAAAAASAQQLRAAAYAVGNDLVFGAGRYAPSSTAGQALLAHEMTHVAQQRVHGVSAAAPLLAHAGDRAEQQADGVAQEARMGLHRRVGSLAAPSARLNLAPETWYRGEVQGVPVARDGGVVHDLGEGLYLTDRAEVAQEYANLRSDSPAAVRRVVAGKFDPKTLGKVLDLTQDAEFMRWFNTLKETMPKVSGEPYRNLVEGHLKSKGLTLQQFDVVIGPEGVRDGKQMRVAPAAVARIRALLMPLKPGPAGGSGPVGEGGQGGGAKAPPAPPETATPRPPPEAAPTKAPAAPKASAAARSGAGWSSAFGGMVTIGLPLLGGWIHQQAVQKRIQEQAKTQGYVGRDSPSGQGFLYDLGSWFLDPTNEADKAVDTEHRFNFPVWRERIRKAANARPAGQTLSMTWDIAQCGYDIMGRQNVEQREVVYRKQADGRWIVQSGDASGTPDLNDIVSTQVGDEQLKSIILRSPCEA